MAQDVRNSGEMCRGQLCSRLVVKDAIAYECSFESSKFSVGMCNLLCHYPYHGKFQSTNVGSHGLVAGMRLRALTVLHNVLAVGLDSD